MELSNKHLEILKNKQFAEYYYGLLINRVTHSNMSLERDLGDINNSTNAIKLKNNMLAFQKLLTHFDYLLDEDLIIEIANRINRDSIYISNGYRKIGEYIADTEIPITKPDKISEEMQNLIHKYYTEWNSMDIYEKEARFHLEFIRIHPFEDGNGRSSRLLLNYNMLKNGYAPIIIPIELSDQYFDNIKRYDVQGLKRMIYKQSEQEFYVIDKLIEEFQLDFNLENKEK